MHKCYAYFEEISRWHFNIILNIFTVFQKNIFEIVFQKENFSFFFFKDVGLYKHVLYSLYAF